MRPTDPMLFINGEHRCISILLEGRQEWTWFTKRPTQRRKESNICASFQPWRWHSLRCCRCSPYSMGSNSRTPSASSCPPGRCSRSCLSRCPC